MDNFDLENFIFIVIDKQMVQQHKLTYILIFYNLQEKYRASPLP